MSDNDNDSDQEVFSELRRSFSVTGAKVEAMASLHTEAPRTLDDERHAWGIERENLSADLRVAIIDRETAEKGEVIAKMKYTDLKAKYKKERAEWAAERERLVAAAGNNESLLLERFARHVADSMVEYRGRTAKRQRMDPSTGEPL
jgi:hypothetical protein